MSIENYLDELQRFADENYHSELIAARVEYFAGLGRMSESEESFEAHLDRFLDWFLFEQNLPQTGKTPLRSFLDEKHEMINPEDLFVFEGFTQNIHSLFMVKKTDKRGVHLRDMFTKEKHYIEEEIPSVFSKGQIFEARLLPYKGSLKFSKGYIFHPMTAGKHIEKMIKNINIEEIERQKALMRDLAIRRLKADRYKHIEAIEFYKL